MSALVMLMVLQSAPEVTLKIGVEEGKRVLLATVTRDGKPIEKATVTFTALRSFGSLSLGREETLEDGTAAIAYPEDLPPETNGEIVFLAGTGDSKARFVVRVPVNRVDEPFPPTLWAPAAPPALIVVVVTLLAIVWCTYAYVGFQLVRLWKGGRQPCEPSSR